jgi:hypothetical protein
MCVYVCVCVCVFVFMFVLFHLCPPQPSQEALSVIAKKDAVAEIMSDEQMTKLLDGCNAHLPEACDEALSSVKSELGKNFNNFKETEKFK